MFTGIDIGGTNTDIAFIKGSSIETVKISNETGLSSVLSETHSNGRLAISTSQPLNQMITGSTGDLCTVTIPGPGIRRAGSVKGAVTIRGDIAEDIDPAEVRSVFEETNARYLAVAGKFSTRNPELEEKVLEIALDYFSEDRIALSHHIGEMGFPTRIETTAINARIKEIVKGISEITASATSEDFFFMKGDGGLSSPRMLSNTPSELFSSSQAAVALGASYLTGIEDALVMDIGGTTTDLVPMKGGLPERKVVSIGGSLTGVWGVHALTIPYGGDSVITDSLLPFREGVSLAFGGKSRTLTDALNVCGREIGDFRASEVIDRETSEMAFSAYLEEVSDAISQFSPSLIIGTGYLANALSDEISSLTGIRVSVPEHSESANAVGVAVSRVSLSMKVHYDSEKGRLSVNGELRQPREILSDEELISLCKTEIMERALDNGAVPEDCEDIEIQGFRAYDVIRGKTKTGRIVDLSLAITPGISAEAP